MTPFWETVEGELAKINIYWNKNFEAPWINEDDITLDETTVVEFLLKIFGKKHLYLKGIVGIDTEVARKHLGFILFNFVSFLPFIIYIRYLLLISL